MCPLICDMDGDGDGVSRAVFVVLTESAACGSYEIFNPPLLLPPLNELKSGVLEEVINDEKGAGADVSTVETAADDLNAGKFAVPVAFANRLEEGLGMCPLFCSLSPPAILLLLVTTP